MTEDAKKPLGRILLRQQAVTQPQLDRALEGAIPGGPPLASRMTESGTLSEIAALKALSEQSGVPGIDLNQVCIRLRDLAILPREVAVRHKLLPVLVREDRVFVAMANPSDKKVIDELEFVTGKHLFPYVALAGPLMRTISTAYELRERGEAFYVGPQCPPEMQRKVGCTPREADAVSSATGSSRPITGATGSGGSQLAPNPLPQGARLVAQPPVASRPPQPPPLPTSRSSTMSAAPGHRVSPGPPGAGTPPAQPPAPPEGPGRDEENRTANAPPSHGSQRHGTAPPSSRGRPPDSGGTSELDLGIHPVTARALGSPPRTAVIVDDAMRVMAGSQEFTDADFGNVGKDVSIAGRLPTDPSRPVIARTDGKRVVLVVDDEADIRKLVRRILEDRGYLVIEAARGHEALSVLKEQAPDLMVLDAMLPDVHGFDIAKRMKGSDRYGHIPIVMISAVFRGWRIAEDLRVSYGVEAYLEKPFSIADLVRAVEFALAHRPPAGSAEEISAEAEKMLALGIEAYQKGDLDHAVAHLREGTRIDPLAYRLHFHLGLLYGKQGKIYDAIQELQIALDINGGHFPALKNLAVLYQKIGFRNKAIEAWEHALRVAPDDATRQSIKEHLVGLL